MATTNDNFSMILDYIEENLCTPLNTSELARVSYRSIMQLYRDFYSITGYSIKEYVRRRRLSKALSLVKYSELPLSEIAYELGYSSQQAFCKSVKSATNLTPLEYKFADTYYYFPKFQGNLNLQITVSTQTIPETICLPYYSSQAEQIETHALESLTTLLPDFHGRVWGRNVECKDSMYCYELMIENSELTTAQTHLLTHYTNDCYIFPSFSSLFATTITTNIYEEILTNWNFLYNSWIQHSMFVPSTLPYFEEYLLKHGVRNKLMLYLPIEKQATPYQIQIEDLESFTVLISNKLGVHSEEEASFEIVDFLQANYPYLLKRCTTMFTRQ